jgi:hypothetical protein
MTYQTAYGASARHRERLRTEGRTDEEIFQAARRNIDTFSVVGVQENMVDFVTKMERRFDVDLMLGSINQNEQRAPVEDISFGTKSRILEWVYMDMELYDHILQLCQERAEPAPQIWAPVTPPNGHAAMSVPPPAPPPPAASSPPSKMPASKAPRQSAAKRAPSQARSLSGQRKATSD